MHGLSAHRVRHQVDFTDHRLVAALHHLRHKANKVQIDFDFISIFSILLIIFIANKLGLFYGSRLFAVF